MRDQVFIHMHSWPDGVWGKRGDPASADQDSGSRATQEWISRVAALSAILPFLPFGDDHLVGSRDRRRGSDRKRRRF